MEKCNVNGSSIRNAIIIPECAHTAGISQKYRELKVRFGQYKMISQRLLEINNRKYDILEIEVNGEKVEVHFDITILMDNYVKSFMPSFFVVI